VKQLELIPFPEQEEEAVKKASEIMMLFVSSNTRFGSTLIKLWTEKKQDKNPSKWVIKGFGTPAQVTIN
jgi:hypothetical protein